ncbi:c-type cytochrome [Sphingomonas parva]|uniref:C-type cytochrome n=1 Tax=Sphingomonas parva TaxID=2555898 RepID=A0A4Y8ZPJ3_9SPHN|nr:c-type cytochrome [Sphingomonas parva]
MAARARRRWEYSAPAALLAVMISGCSAVDTASADRFAQTGELIALSGGHAGAANACITCHGLEGRGNGAGVPRLAGLESGYLNRQMESYASGLRQHPQMQYVAGKLSARDRQAVSAYYAAMPFAPGPMPQAPPPQLWLIGDPARDLQPCAACHGLRGEGIGPANPALGAQPAAYHLEQLEKWRRSERRNDPMNVMQTISVRLTPAERAALAAYAGALPGGPPRPGSPEAFPAAHRVDPRNGASGLRPHEAVP